MIYFSEAYIQFREPSIHDRFISHDRLKQLIADLGASFNVSEAGKSFDGKEVYLLRIGTGPVRIFLWSQMHGNESTATAALFDLFNFLQGDEDGFREARSGILENCTLYFMPMVNPDGAGAFTRRNAQGIDINRDFLRLQSPEARILKDAHTAISPHFGFNLHDQDTIWSARDTGNPAAISLVAPPSDEHANVSPTRKHAMQVVSEINAEIQQLVPGHVGRWTDEFEPRSFGDNFQKLGTGTILIESGGYYDDLEKQYVRMLTFTAILTGLISIATGSYKDADLKNYHSIPENRKQHPAILLRNCLAGSGTAPYRIDIAIIARDELDGHSVCRTYYIDDIGDLSHLYGYKEIDATACKLILVRPLTCEQPADLILQDNLDTLLRIENGRLTSMDF